MLGSSEQARRVYHGSVFDAKKGNSGSMPTNLNTLYGELRAQLLSRHFALGRYFRTDHLSFSNNLGVVHQTSTGTPDTENDLIHDCLWSDVLGGPGAEVFQPASVYDNASALLAKSPSTRLFEHWRVGDHSRANPLMYSAQLMVCLAVEVALGIPGSLDILSRLLATTKSLFKFATPWDGYILRWDAVTSDHWSIVFGENAIVTDHCCDFLTDADTPGGYLFSTPLDDPRYTPYMAQSQFNSLTPDQMTQYQQARLLSIDQNRYWEPSQDELTGLLAGFSFVVQLVTDPGIQAEVVDQARRIGGYLAANGYLLVRPGGGFAAQGGSDIAPALEFPFGRVFSRITGSDFSATTDFDGALKNAGLWSDFSQGFLAAGFIGILVAPLAYALAIILGGAIGIAIVAALLSIGGTYVLGKAAVIWLNYESFDVSASPGATGVANVSKANNDEQRAFVGAYLLGLFPKKLRFMGWLFLARTFGTGYAQNFPPFLGLMAFGDSDTTISNAFLGWFNARGGTMPPPQTTIADPVSATATALTVASNAGFPSPPFNVTINQEDLLITAVGGTGNTKWAVTRAQRDTIAAAASIGDSVISFGAGFDDAQSDFPNIIDPFATAVAVLLGAGTAEQMKLVTLLNDLGGEFDNFRIDELGVFDDNNPLTGAPYVTETIRPAMNFMAALALAWLFSKTQSDMGSPLPASLGFPTPPPAGTVLPAATITKEVIEGAFGATTAQQVIPLSGLPPLPNPSPVEVDLFSIGAPRKPPDAPEPITTASWILSVTASRYGNLFGSSGTETFNAGVMLPTRDCLILGVKLILVDKHGVPLGGVATSTSLGRQAIEKGGAPWPSLVAVDGSWPFRAGAQIISIATDPTDESVVVHWWYNAFRAVRFQLAYLVQGTNCSL